MVSELREKHGIEPTLDEVVWLHEIGKEMMSPGGSAPAHALGMPVTIGSGSGALSLWPHTVGASQWWMRAAKWFEEEEDGEQVWVLIYSLVFARNADKLRSCSNRALTMEAVEALKADAFVTQEEITWALEQLLPDSEDQPKSDKDVSNESAEEQSGKFLSAMCLEFGGTPEDWRWAEDSSFLGDMLRHSQAQKAAAQGIQCTDPARRADSKMLAAKIAIIESHKESADNG